METMTTISILALMVFLTVGAFESLKSTARLTAAQSLVSACEEARSEAMRTGAPSLIAFRKTKDDVGVEALREFGISKTKTTMAANGAEQRVTQMNWYPLPKGIVLWTGMPKKITTGTNALKLAARPAVEFGVAAIPQADTLTFQAMVFGDLGEVVFPTAQSGGAGQPPTPGPYYLAVAEEVQIGMADGPVNYQLIEIRPATGRALLLP